MLEVKFIVERETDGNETPMKYPKTIPITVVIKNLDLSFDFFENPLRCVVPIIFENNLK